jgi:pimeloyl-ACP methyl ester carboxylesterase
MIDDYFTLSNGQKLHYLKMGSNSQARMTVVLLHGFGGNLLPFGPIQRELTGKEIPSIAIDLLGHGKSSRRIERTDDYLSSMSEGVWELIKGLGIQRVVMAGHCMGGMVAALLSAQHADNVEGLFLISSSLYPYRQLARGFWSPVIRSGCAILGRVLPVRPLCEATDCRQFKETKDYHWGRIAGDVLSTGLGSYVTNMQGVFGRDLLEELPKSEKPVYILAGTDDVVTRVEEVREYEQIFTRAIMRVEEGVGHIAVISHPDLVARHLVTFYRLMEKNMETRSKVN